MHERIIAQTLGKMTKILLAPVGPLQYFLDFPGITHIHCLEQAYNALEHDGKENITIFFKKHHQSLKNGLFWADRGWKNVCHYYQKPGRKDVLQWPGATGEC